MAALLPGIILISPLFASCPEDGCAPLAPAQQAGAWIGAALIAAVKVYNRWYLQGTTGQSWGKRRYRLRLVRMADKQPIGFRGAFERGLVHIIDILSLGVGYLLPLWDKRRQTLADKVMRTVVISEDKAGAKGPQTSR